MKIEKTTDRLALELTRGHTDTQASVCRAGSEQSDEGKAVLPHEHLRSLQPHCPHSEGPLRAALRGLSREAAQMGLRERRGTRGNAV